MSKRKDQPEKTQESFPVTVDLIGNYAIFSLDMHGTITSWNRGAEYLTGWKKDEVIGKYFDFLYPDDEQKRDRPGKVLSIAHEEGKYEGIGYQKRKNDELFLADSAFNQVHIEKTGTQRGYIVIMKDITSQRRLEDAQTDANKLLRQEVQRRKKIEAALTLSNEELDAFASAASHDLQEPLRMVISYLQLIEKRYGDVFDKDGREFLDFAIDGAVRMRTLINDLVEYSRIDTLGKHLQETDATESLLRAIDNMSVIIKENNAKITYDKLPVVQSDEVQLTRLFQNLLVNAIKFRREEPPKIHISADEDVDEWIFHVADNGKGIEPKNLDRVFQIFKQLGPKAERKGSGIGLAIAKKIVARHGGRIWATSEAGIGTTIHFCIPKIKRREEKYG